MVQITAVFCSNSAPNFVNEKYCRLSYSENACTRRDKDWEDIILTVPLTNITLSEMYRLTSNSRNVYAIEGLVFDDTNMQKFGLTPLVYTPCARNSMTVYQENDGTYFNLVDDPRLERTITRAKTTSRWIKEDDGSVCDTPAIQVANSTAALFARLLMESTDANPILRDITIHANMEQCDLADENKHGMAIRDADGNCWRNVHPDYFSVYDLTDYVATVDISATSWTTSITPSGIVSYPSNSTNYTMMHWELLTRPGNKNKIRYIGRFGDQIEVVDLVNKMQFSSAIDNIFLSSEAEEADNAIVAIANALGDVTLEAQFHKTGRDGGVVVCGHPGEVAPDPTIEDTFEIDTNDRTKPYERTHLPSQKVNETIDGKINWCCHY